MHSGCCEGGRGALYLRMERGWVHSVCRGGKDGAFCLEVGCTESGWREGGCTLYEEQRVSTLCAEGGCSLCEEGGCSLWERGGWRTHCVRREGGYTLCEEGRREGALCVRMDGGCTQPGWTRAHSV